MHHSVQLTDSAFRAYQSRAKKAGLTVDEYLNRCAPTDAENFGSLTPETLSAIERSLAQADMGQLLGVAEVKASLDRYKKLWREESES